MSDETRINPLPPLDNGLVFAQSLAIAACPVSRVGHKHVSYPCRLCSRIAEAISAAVSDYWADSRGAPQAPKHD